MSCIGVIASVLVVYLLFIQQGTANNCTCVKHSNNSYTFKLSSSGQNCEEKTWNSQVMNSQETVLSTIEKHDRTVILEKGDDFISTLNWVPNVTYAEECHDSSGKMVVVPVKCPENPSDCDYTEPSSRSQDTSSSVKRQRWGLVAFTVVLLILTLLVLISSDLLPNSVIHRLKDSNPINFSSLLVSNKHLTSDLLSPFPLYCNSIKYP